MKLSEVWLREWVNPQLNLDALSHKLTMSGLEVEDVHAVNNKNFNKFVVGKLIDVRKHPEKDQLKICQVDIGNKNKLTIVCGANNVRKESKVIVALIDAVLPSGKNITATSFGGILSSGMLCSAAELELSDESEGLFLLPDDAPIGQPISEYLLLNDYILDLSITPNRGDCLSIKGIAREISALTHTRLNTLIIEPIKATYEKVLPIRILTPQDCPRYVGRIIHHVKTDATTPIWMQERLRRAGIRRINPIVDVTNYVMLELGQPMHAFDLNKIESEIQVRRAEENEKIVLLDGSEQHLNDQTLVIADAKTPLAIAGVMGGVDSSVTLSTTDIFLESAYFSPKCVASSRQYYHLNSDSAYRFERGVDPMLQHEAIERATALILSIAGGSPGPISEMITPDMPKPVIIFLSRKKLAKLLGIEIQDQTVESIWDAFNFSFHKKENGWEVIAPSYRPDLVLAEDLIEEIARLYGYQNIPLLPLEANIDISLPQTSQQNVEKLRQALCNQDFNEIISYSFVDEKTQMLLNPDGQGIHLVNPISQEMSVMRSSLWPGLIKTLMFNKNRQQDRIRLFEIGLCFDKNSIDALEQASMLAGVATGNVFKEQWGISNDESVGFFDLKNNIINALSQIIQSEHLIFKPVNHSVLHPGQSAAIYYQQKKIGVIGLLHPKVAQQLEWTLPIYVFEIYLDYLSEAKTITYEEYSKFPEIRRDLAILVNETIPSQDIQDTIKKVAGDWLKEIFIFDVYQGKGIPPDQKSVAIALIMQHPSRTLVDDEVNELLNRVKTELNSQFGAELRS